MQLILSDKQPTDFKPDDRDDFLKRLINTQEAAVRQQAFKTPLPTQSIAHQGIPEAPIYHQNYLEYLDNCWGLHRGAIFSPEMLWYGVVAELALHIKSNADFYREHFTTSNEKQDISIPNGDLVVMDLQTLVDALRPRVPANMNLFLLDFTTSTYHSRMATFAAFADAVSPYYNYFVFACGIPQIRVEGTVEDWRKISNSLSELQVMGKAQAWLAKIKGHVDQIVDQFETGIFDPVFWRKMHHLERCGSGSQSYTTGWITDFFMTKPRTAYTENFSTHVSKVAYTQLQTQKSYEMYQGLFSSQDVDGFLIPSFSFLVVDVTEKN